MDDNTKDVFLFGLPLVSMAVNAWIARKMGTVEEKVDAVAKIANGHNDRLLSETKAAAHSEGKLEERAEQIAREAERAIGAAQSFPPPKDIP